MKALWVKIDNGDVVRFDPESGKEVATIPTGGAARLCQGFGAGEDAIWSCPWAGSITRIDPDSNSVTDEIRIDGLPEQGRLVSVADRLWVLAKSGAQLTGLDLRTGKPAESIKLGGTTDGVMSSIGFFDTSEHADESTRLASNWVREEKLETALSNPPKVTSGKVVVNKTREPVQA